jgi:hypothetical protein
MHHIVVDNPAIVTLLHLLPRRRHLPMIALEHRYMAYIQGIHIRYTYKTSCMPPMIALEHRCEAYI